MYPTNADMVDGRMNLKPVPDGKPQDYWYPQLSDISGSNYFDIDKNTLYFVVKGPTPVEIRTAAVVQVEISIIGITSISMAIFITTIIIVYI